MFCKNQTKPRISLPNLAKLALNKALIGNTHCCCVDLNLHILYHVGQVSFQMRNKHARILHMIQCNTIRENMIGYDMIWYGRIQYDMVQYNTIKLLCDIC